MVQEETKPDAIKNAVMETSPPIQPQQGMEQQGALNEVITEISSASRRIRVLEERFTNLRRKDQVTEQNIVKTNKKVFKEIKATSEEISELRMEIKDIKDKVKIIISELRLYALKEDVKVLEKYVNMWEPVSFVTQREVESIIMEKFAKMGIEDIRKKTKNKGD